MATGNTVFQSFPSVFISSTVRDFRDLRSGIAYHLRSQGFNVSVSEAADFDVQGDRSAAEECFKNIRTSDYYILLIGGRRGSLFQDGVSITRQEYRTAREQFLNSQKPRMLLFMREGIDHALETGGSVQEQAGIDYPEHLQSFIDEVQKPPGQDDPSYLTRFRDYADVMTSLSGSLNIGRNVWETLTRHTLASELAANLADMLQRWHNSAAATHSFMQKVREEINLQDIPPKGLVPVSEEQRKALILAMPGIIHGSELRTRAIEEALGQGVFLEFNPNSNSFEETLLHEHLGKTLEDIKLLAKLDPQVDSGSWNSRLQAALAYPSGGNGAPCSALREDLLFAFAYYDRVENIFNGHVSLCKALLGLVDNFPVYKRRPLTPLGKDEERRLMAERVLPQEVVRLVTNEIQPFGTKLMARMFGQTRDDQIQRLADGMRKSLNSYGIRADLPDGFFSEAAAEFLDSKTVQPKEGIEDLSEDSR